MKLNRMWLIGIIALLLAVHVSFFIIDANVSDAEIVPGTYVRFVSTEKLSQPEKDKLFDLARDPLLSKTFNFAVIDGGNERLQSHIKDYKITGSVATILTDSTGKEVIAKYPKILSKDELAALAKDHK